MEKFRIQQPKFSQEPELLPGLGMEFSIPPNAGLKEKDALVHVIHDLPRGVHVKQPFYVGFTVDWSKFFFDKKDEDNTFVVLAPDDMLKLFCCDGRVVVVENIDGHCTVRSLALQDALQARLDLIVEKLDKAEVDRAYAGHDATVKKIDRSLHELAILLEMSNGRPTQRNHILLFAEQVMTNLVVRTGVRRSFEEVLQRQGDPTFYGWLAGKVEVVDEKVIDLGAERQRRGPPASALKRKQDRANADRVAREQMKGKGGEKPLHGQGGKKGEKKGNSRD